MTAARLPTILPSERGGSHEHSHTHSSADDAGRPDQGRAGHHDGRVHAPVLGARGAQLGADRGRGPDPAEVVGRAADRLPGHRWHGRGDGPPLPSPQRLAVPGPQRRGRDPLRLPRLEVRRRRRLPRPGERAPRGPVLRQGAGPGLSDRRAQRPGLDLHGPPRRPPPLPQIEATLLSASEPGDPAGDAVLQLAPGARGRHRHLALRVPARRPHPARGVGRRQPDPGHGCESCAPLPRARHPLGYLLWRLPARTERGQHLLAVRQLPVPVLDSAAPGPVRSQRPRPRLGAARRPPHHVPQHHVGRGRRQPCGGTQATRRQPDRGAQPGQRVPAQHHRLAGPVAPARQPRQRLGDRPRRPARGPHLHRHHQHPPAGPGGDRIDGADQRLQPRAPLAQRPHDRPDQTPRALDAARAFRDTGEPSPGVDDAHVYLGSRSGFFVAPETTDWIEAYESNLARADRPAGVS